MSDHINSFHSTQNVDDVTKAIVVSQAVDENTSDAYQEQTETVHGICLGSCLQSSEKGPKF